MAGSVGNKILNGVATVVVVVLTVCAVRFNVPQYREYKKSIALRDDLQARFDADSLELAELRGKQERFHSDEDFIIQEARRNKRIFPGEVLFVFPGPDSDSK